MSGFSQRNALHKALFSDILTATLNILDASMGGTVTQSEPTLETTLPKASATPWLTPGVRGIGLASFLADMGHEVPTALFASLMVSVLGASAAVLGLVEGLADGLAGLARLLGGPLADDPARRRQTAIGGYLSTAVLASLIGAAGAVWQVAMLRMAAWTAGACSQYAAC